ncbi:eukaryotic aspartyl protease family protein [Actinidia rufa]|uniref:Eukaryotic aspartyl protease family protein n=1 Tax=Actinidia rufa TaxID=165716 RepID=A0A7J0F3Q3_9ERIC|nr:eukaryotic aspartyl protease family protein [Actinidia rufa]
MSRFYRIACDFFAGSAVLWVIWCGARQSGDLGSSDEALDGILGFGKSNSSMISQLASTGKVKRMFAHCLDGVNGGGIFAIGHVVEPKVNTTPLVPNQPHYNINMTAVEVGLDFLNLTTNVFEFGNKKGTIIDSGTTLAYLPEVIYVPLVKKILSWQSDLKLRTLEEQYTCFQYSDRQTRDWEVVELMGLHETPYGWDGGRFNEVE